MKITPSSCSGWHTAAPPSLTSHQKYWLFRPGALTAGLRQLGEFKLRVAREKAEGLHPQEAWMLSIPPRKPIWLREVCMSIDAVDCVFARSFTPLSASHALWQGMRRLKTRPLADMLYHNPEIVRSPFFVDRLHRQHPFYRAMQGYFATECPDPADVLARCSVFWRQGQPLLVAEAFLPAFWSVAGSRRP